MKLVACIKKDIRLVFGKGWKSILFLLVPILLLLVMTQFMGGMADAGTATDPFSIAVRDEDDTMMSKMLIHQLRSVRLFEKVASADGASDEELLRNGCAAVITIPKDFFYDLYDMQDTDVIVTLNGSMPKESAIVRSAVASLAGILEENQRIYYAAARVRHGDLGTSELNEVYYAYSEASVNDALNRLDYFSLTSLYGEKAQARMVFFAAGICSVLLLFVPLCVLRSLHEEQEMGIQARFASTGGSPFVLLFAKYCATLILVGFTVTPLLILTGIPHVGKLILPLLCLVSAAFLLFYLVGILCGSTERAQLIGSVLLLLMLLLGGGLFPYRLLPEQIRFASASTIPYYVTRVFYAASLDRSLLELLRILLPLFIALPVMTVLVVLAHRIRRRA
jgi:ABC-type multidrug transport system permease subunit